MSLANRRSQRLSNRRQSLRKPKRKRTSKKTVRTSWAAKLKKILRKINMKNLPPKSTVGMFCRMYGNIYAQMKADKNEYYGKVIKEEGPSLLKVQNVVTNEETIEPLWGCTYVNEDYVKRFFPNYFL